MQINLIREFLDECPYVGQYSYKIENTYIMVFAALLADGHLGIYNI